MQSSGRSIPRRAALPVLLVAAAIGLIAFWALYRNDPVQKVTAPDVESPGSLVAKGEAEIGARQGALPLPPLGDAEAPRRGILLPALEGTVTNREGSPLQGALVSWTPLVEEFFEGGYVWHSIDWAELRTRSAETTTDAEGRFAFADPIAGGEHGVTVLWVTHPRHEAGALLVPTAEPRAPRKSSIALEGAPPLRVKVVDGPGRPAGSVLVEQFGVRAPPERRSDPRWLAAYRAFRRESRTGPDGMAEQTFSPVGGSYGLLATHGGERSKPWFSSLEELGDPIQLELAPCFVASGRVTWPAARNVLSRGHVGISAVTNAYLLVVTQANVEPDGSWGPATVPLLDVSKYTFRFEARGLAVEEVTRPRPEPGQGVRVDFAPLPGVEVPVSVRDSDGDPVGGADLYLTFGGEGADTWVQAYTDEAGAAFLPGVRPGPVRLSVTANGFPPAQLGPLDIPAANVQPIEVVLAIGGRLSGRVVHAGEPMADFEIAWWTSSLHSGEPPTVERFSGRPDGVFELEGLPQGEVRLLACAPELPRSPAKTAWIELDRSTSVELELPAAIPAQGQVVDAESGRGIAGATLQLFTNDGPDFVHAWGTAVITDSRGAFQLPGLAPGDNRYSVQAPGYATRLASVWVRGSAALDLGPVPLFRAGELIVVLARGDLLGASTYSASLSAARQHGVRAFSEAGEVVFEDVAPGRAVVSVLAPDGGEEWYILDLPPAERTVVEVPIDLGPELVVEVVSTEPGVGPPPGAYVSLRERTPLGLRTRSKPLAENGTARLTCRAPGDVVVTAFSGDGKPIGSEALHVDATGAHLRLVMGSREATIVVVDHMGEPISNAEVHLYSEEDSSGWTAFANTDSEGHATLGGLPFERCLGGAIHPQHGMRFGVEIEAGPPTLPTRLELVADTAVHLRLLDGTQPARGIQVRALGGGGTYLVGYASSDDEGRVAFAPLGDGSYSITVQHPGYFPSTRVVPTRPADDPYSLSVYRFGSLEIVCKTVQGVPVSGLALELRHDELDSSLSEWLAQGLLDLEPGSLLTDSLGHLFVPSVPRGTYHWGLASPSGSSLEGKVEVLAAAKAVLELVLPE